MFDFIRKLFSKRSFEAAASSRLYPSVPQTAKINDDLRRSISALRDQGRSLEQNTDSGKRFLSLARINVIGPRGIILHSVVRGKSGELDTNLNNEIEREFLKFAEKIFCEVSGRYSWIEVQYLFLSALLRDGEAIVRHVRGWRDNPYGYAIQVIEADLLDENLNMKDERGNPKIVMGIEINKWNRPIAYYFLSREGVDGATRLSNGKAYHRIPADEITHLFIPVRSSAVRGYSEFSAASRRMRLLSGYEEAELAAARAGACKMGFYKKVGGEGLQEFEGEDYKGDEAENFMMRAEPATFSVIPDGYEFQQFNPEYPHGNFEAFRKSQLRGIAAALNIGYNDLASDYEGVNYTSLRASALTDRDYYELLQGYVIRSLCADVYRQWFKSAFLKGAFKYVTIDNFEACQSPLWRGRRWKWVDPYKEARANIDLKNEGLLSEREILSDRGSEIEDVYQQYNEARKLRDKLGLSFGAEEGRKDSEAADIMDDGKEPPEAANKKGAVYAGHRTY